MTITKLSGSIIKRFDRVEAVAQQSVDYVISTLDGATARSAEAAVMLAALGRRIAAQDSILVIGGVGVGLREHYLHSTGLPSARVLNGGLALLSHQVTAKLPPHPATNAAALASASFAYHHFPNRLSFLLDTTDAGAARRFAALYNRNRVSRCGPDASGAVRNTHQRRVSDAGRQRYRRLAHNH
ncbi:MAG: hypothetical protein ACT4PG_09525 [Panacagrimonas sp.]